MDHIALAQQLRHLVIFKNLRTEPLVAALADALEKGDTAGVCDLAAELYPRGMNLRQAMATLLLQDDNFCVREAAALRPLPRLPALAEETAAAIPATPPPTTTTSQDPASFTFSVIIIYSSPYLS